MAVLNEQSRSLIDNYSNYSNLTNRFGAVKKGHHYVKKATKKTYSTTYTFAESFKKFIETRNVVDVAVAFVMGLAFREICLALVSDIFRCVIISVAPL